jgi:hypothetical protein
VKVSESFFTRNPIETRVAPAAIRETSDLLRLLLNGGHSAKAGCIAAEIRETDPFAPKQAFAALPAVAAPIVARIRAMWESMRSAVIGTFPKAPGLPRNRKAYLRRLWAGFPEGRGNPEPSHRGGTPARYRARLTKSGIANCSSPAWRRARLEPPRWEAARDAYLDALNRASIDMRIEPFARFIGERVRRAMQQAVRRRPRQSAP